MNCSGLERYLVYVAKRTKNKQTRIMKNNAFLFACFYTRILGHLEINNNDYGGQWRHRRDVCGHDIHIVTILVSVILEFT